MTPGPPARLTLLAPLSGELVPLALLSDPVFSQKMVGEGIAIDPLDQVLRAPCAGEITHLHAAGHALTLVSADGVQVLMHVGIDTVKLGGQGFSPKVKKGDVVSAGAPLIEFDLDFLATHAKSLLTVVVITNSQELASIEHGSGMVQVGVDPIFSVTLGHPAEEAAPAPSSRRVSPPIRIPNATGLHVRTSALLANTAKTFRSEIQLQLDGKAANAKSVTSIMGLDAGFEAQVTLSADGPDAAAAIAKLTEVIEQRLGEETAAAAPKRQSAPAPAGRWPHSSDPNLIRGVSASPGIGVGNIFQIRHQEIPIVEHADDPAQERKMLDAAIGQAKRQLEGMRAQAGEGGVSDRATIFAAHAELVEDPALVDFAIAGIAKGKSAAFAWKAAYENSARLLGGMHNHVLAQRAADLRDVGERVLQSLTGIRHQPRSYPGNAILITEELTPSDTASLDRTRIRGFCTTRGSATSHVSILARSLGIPGLAGTDPRALEVPDGTLAILDADTGSLHLNASLAEMARLLEVQKAAREAYDQALASAHEPAVTLDGHRIEVGGNVDNAQDAERVRGLGGDGIGLLRSEFLFLERTTAPTEEEQFAVYKSIAEQLGAGHRVVIRTLDIGADKPLPFLALPSEEIPFLGERGIRVCLDRPEILRTQLRAILRASAHGDFHVMFPMVSLLNELRQARAILEEEARSLNIPPVPAGMMVEIPAAALQAGQFAKEADFFSIGTNDLTQYTLAMDRAHPKLAPQVDGLHPAVLRLIAQSVAGAQAHGKRVGACGGIAGDPQAVPILIGLGLDELSVSLPAIPSVKAQIRRVSRSACAALAQRALDCESPAEVRALVAAATADGSLNQTGE